MKLNLVYGGLALFTNYSWLKFIKGWCHLLNYGWRLGWRFGGLASFTNTPYFLFFFYISGYGKTFRNFGPSYHESSREDI